MPTKTALVVEDDFLIRTLLRRHLTQAGYDVRLTSAGCEALDALAASRFDIVLTDYFLPDLLGTEILARLRAMPAHRDTPVILMSGDLASSFEEAAARYEPVFVLEKPFLVEELLALLVPA